MTENSTNPVTTTMRLGNYSGQHRAAHNLVINKLSSNHEVTGFGIKTKTYGQVRQGSREITHRHLSFVSLK